jgi:endonuclease G, mitochondrial
VQNRRARTDLSVHKTLLLAIAALGTAACTYDAESVVEDSSTLEAAPSRVAIPGTGGAALSVHTALGVPEAASTTDPRHYLLVKRQYVTSFDSTRKNPRWTSWEVTPAWLGNTPRSPGFKIDTQLPATIPQAKDADYRGSGYQRGHICPSADRTKSREDNEATFLFTNVVPQTGASNMGPWASLEDKERVLARSGQHVSITVGSIYRGQATIGDGVAIPSSMFKIVVATRTPHPGPSDIDATARVIAVEIPNTDAVAGSYHAYRTTFARLEEETGFRFLSDVPAAVHDALASQVDTEAFDPLAAAD